MLNIIKKHKILTIFLLVVVIIAFLLLLFFPYDTRGCDAPFAGGFHLPVICTRHSNFENIMDKINGTY